MTLLKSIFALVLWSFCSLAHADTTPVIAIGAGSSSSSGSFLSDRYFSGGSTYFNNIPIDTGQVTNPAPSDIYRNCRFGDFAYQVSGLVPGAPHKIRLHFDEIYFTSAGSRVFNVAIGGNSVLSNFDILAATGAQGKATVREFTANADSSGAITISFTSVVNNAQVNAIEILAIHAAQPVPTNPLFKLGSNQPGYQVGQSASLVVRYLAAPESDEFEYFSASTFDGAALPVRNASKNFAVAVTPPFDFAGQKAWTVTVYLQNKQLAHDLEETIEFLQGENERIEKSLSETSDPGTIAALERERARNLLLLERARNELTAGRRQVGLPQTLIINVS